MSKNSVDPRLALACVLLMGSFLSCGRRHAPALRSGTTAPSSVESAESAQAARSPSVPQEPTADQKSSLLVTIDDWDLTGDCLAHLVAATLIRDGFKAWPQHLDQSDVQLYAAATKISGKVHLSLQGSFFRDGDRLLPDLYFATVVDDRGPPTQTEVDVRSSGNRLSSVACLSRAGQRHRGSEPGSANVDRVDSRVMPAVIPQWLATQRRIDHSLRYSCAFDDSRLNEDGSSIRYTVRCATVTAPPDIASQLTKRRARCVLPPSARS